MRYLSDQKGRKIMRSELGSRSEPAEGLVFNHQMWLVSAVPLNNNQSGIVLVSDSPMPWVHKGLANNHKICNPFNWTRYGTEDFLGSKRTRGRFFKPKAWKHNRLEPDGWLMRISKYWPWTYKNEITGAEREKNEAGGGRYRVDGFLKSLELIFESTAAEIITCAQKSIYESGFLRIHQQSIKKCFFLSKGVFFLLTSPLMGDPVDFLQFL